MGDRGDEQASTSLICWGSGEFGQHCHGDSQDVAFDAGIVPLFQSSSWSDQVKLVSCGASHTVAVTNSNDLYVWGNGNSGQLGCGNSETKWKPARVDLSTQCQAPIEIEGVSCGGRHTVVWMKDGSVIGFGNNSYAQLGHINDTKRKKENQCIPRLLDFLPKPVSSVACGDKHTVFLMKDGSVACAGNNHHGQIGSEGQKEATLPRFVDLDEPIKQVVAGANHSLALSVSGTVYLWGYGKACHGHSASDILQPEKLIVPSPVHQVSAGSTHSVLVTISGDVFTWGDGIDGQLGQSESVISLAQPTLLPCDWLKGRVVGVACGECLTAAITDKAELYMWGRNSHTIKPDLSSSSRICEPVRITPDDMSVRAVSCGTWHASVILNIPVSEMKDPPVKVQVTSEYIDVEINPECLQPSDDSKASDSSVTNGNIPPNPEDLDTVDNLKLPETVKLPGATDSNLNPKESTWPHQSEGPQRKVLFGEDKTQSLPGMDKLQRTVLPKLHVAVPQNVMLTAESGEEKPSGTLPQLGPRGSELLLNVSLTSEETGISEKKETAEIKESSMRADITLNAVPAMTGFPKRREPSFWRSRTIFPKENPYSVAMNRSEAFYPEAEPYAIHVSKSTAAKFSLPKESTFISSKTMGFIPLEQLAESVTWSRDTDTDAFTWVTKHNSSNIESNFVQKGHFPTRQSRFSSAKKFAPQKHVHGLSRHYTTLGLKESNDNSVQNIKVKQTTESPDQSRLQGKPSSHWREGKRESSESMSSVSSSLKYFTPQQVANREWDRKTNWGRGYAIPDLKPLDRNMRNVNNLKSDYKTVSNARRKRKPEPKTKAAVFENFDTGDRSKLGEALATRQQTFILFSNTGR